MELKLGGEECPRHNTAPQVNGRGGVVECGGGWGKQHDFEKKN